MHVELGYRAALAQGRPRGQRQRGIDRTRLDFDAGVHGAIGIDTRRYLQGHAIRFEQGRAVAFLVGRPVGQLSARLERCGRAAAGQQLRLRQQYGFAALGQRRQPGRQQGIDAQQPACMPHCRSARERPGRRRQRGRTAIPDRAGVHAAGGRLVPAQTQFTQALARQLHHLYIQQHHAIPADPAGEVQHLRVALRQGGDTRVVVLGKLAAFDDDMRAHRAAARTRYACQQGSHFLAQAAPARRQHLHGIGLACAPP